MGPIATVTSAVTPLWPIGMLSQGIFSIIDSNRQSELAQKNQEFQRRLDENRKAFQWEAFEKTAGLQREIALLNHNLRLVEQQRAFENTMGQIQIQQYPQNWPFIKAPLVMREETFHWNFSSGHPRAGLRVVLTKSANPFYNQYIQKNVEQSLFQFLKKNYSHTGNYPVFFDGAGWKDLAGGDEDVHPMLYAALKNLPTLIISPNITNHILYLNIAVWGLGVDSWVQETLFEISFVPNNGKKKVNEDEYRNFADILQLYLNFTAGWIADTYYMIEYDQLPLLPGIILHHPDQNEDWSFLKSYFARQYKDSYDYIYGKQPLHINGRDVSLRGAKVYDIPALCLNFSHGAHELIEEYGTSFARDCIRDSMWNWLTLRGMNPEIERGMELLGNVCEAAINFDIPYLNALKQSFITLPNGGELGVDAAICRLNQRIAWLK
jgi:hypothetical protein